MSKNRHLVETARTLLLHHKVPQRFWGDATLAACYLINRMPSSVLHDQIPLSILFLVDQTVGQRIWIRLEHDGDTAGHGRDTTWIRRADFMGFFLL